MHSFSPEQKMFLKENVKGRSRKDLQKIFNCHFDLDLGINQITAFIKNYGLSTGRTGRFEKGQPAWNKGMKGINLAGENGKKTQFKKGCAPRNYRPVGSERIDKKDGYILIKVSDEGRYQDRWKLKHRVLWEQEHGKIPRKHTLIFADGDKQNTNLENLILVKRSQLALLNKEGYLNGDPDTLEAGLKLIEINKKIYDYDVKGPEYEKYQRIASGRGVGEQTFIMRLKRGWSYEQAAYKPLHYRLQSGNGKGSDK